MDGSFTNKTVFRDLPPNTTVVGRIRKDARLFLPPTPSDRPRRGRRRWYGDPLPTPEQIRQDPTIPWVTAPAWGAGQIHRFEVKTLSPVRWAGTGRKDARLVVIRPLAYRPSRMAPGERDSTPRLIGALRSQLWGRALGVNLSHFVNRTEGKMNAGKIGDALPSAVCYAFR